MANIHEIGVLWGNGGQFPDWSPDLRPAFVCCLGHSTFVEHVVTYFTEDLKLFFASESVSILTIFHDVEHV